MTTIARKVMWIGRATVFCVGLAVTLTLIFGAATAALAAVPGDPFKLGRTNTIDQMSTLIGSTSGALLRINNNGGGPALDLRVEPGETPMNVNSTTRVNGLNADHLDGKDSTAFVPTESYTVTELLEGEGGGDIEHADAKCDRGDTLLGGGFDASADDTVISSEPLGSDVGWSVAVKDNGISTVTFVTALCADLPPLRP